MYLVRNVRFLFATLLLLVGVGSAQTLTSITVSPSAVTGVANDVDDVIVTGVYSDGSYQDLSAVATVTSNQLSVATITPTGPGGASQINIQDSNTEGFATVTAVYVSGTLVFSVNVPVVRIAGGGSLGIPTFSTQDGGPIDTIDPASDNVHISIPFRSKAGKIPFSFSLESDSVAREGSKGKGGLTKFWSIHTGLVGKTNSNLSASLNAVQLPPKPKCPGWNFQDLWYTPIFVVDGSGAEHQLYTDGTGTTPLSADSEGCKYGNTVTGVTIDGSGFTAVIDHADIGMFYGVTAIYDRSGNSLKILGNSSGLTRTLTDPDGNHIQAVETATSQTVTTVYSAP
jgi:hypothetical protein